MSKRKLVNDTNRINLNISTTDFHLILASLSLTIGATVTASERSKNSVSIDSNSLTYLQKRYEIIYDNLQEQKQQQRQQERSMCSEQNKKNDQI